MVPSHGWCVLCRSPETGTPGMKVGNTAYNGGRGAGGGRKRVFLDVRLYRKPGKKRELQNRLDGSGHSCGPVTESRKRELRKKLKVALFLFRFSFFFRSASFYRKRRASCVTELATGRWRRKVTEMKVGDSG